MYAKIHDLRNSMLPKNIVESWFPNATKKGFYFISKESCGATDFLFNSL